MRTRTFDVSGPPSVGWASAGAPRRRARATTKDGKVFRTGVLVPSFRLGVAILTGPKRSSCRRLSVPSDTPAGSEPLECVGAAALCLLDDSDRRQADSLCARERDELQPTFAQLQKNANVVMRWFARGKLWASREAERDDFQQQRQAATAPRPRNREDSAPERRGNRLASWRCAQACAIGSKRRIVLSVPGQRRIPLRSAIATNRATQPTHCVDRMMTDAGRINSAVTNAGARCLPRPRKGATSHAATSGGHGPASRATRL